MSNDSRKRAARGRLDRKIIVDGCLSLLAREGAQGFSMPALGRELGVDPSAVYRYFRGKDDLIVAATDEYIARLKIEEIRESCWVETLAAIGRRFWSVGSEQPGAMALTGSRTAAMPGTFRAANHMIGVFMEAGFDPDDSARLYRALVDLVLSLTQQHALVLDMGVVDQSMEAQNAFRGVDPKRYPHIAAAADAVATRTADENFELTLAMFLESAALTAPGRCSGHTHSLRGLGPAVN